MGKLQCTCCGIIASYWQLFKVLRIVILLKMRAKQQTKGRTKHRMGPYGHRMGPCGLLWDRMGPYETVWALMGPHGHRMGPYGTIWDSMTVWAP